MNEPILLVGETGTGKTSVIQYLAAVLRQKLVVVVSLQKRKKL
jgi:midasin